jgi:hypothetical protein
MSRPEVTRRATRAGLIGAALGLVVACSSAAPPATFGANPIQQLVTDGGTLHVDVYSAPDPPARGTDEFRFVVTDAVSGAPVDGLTVDVVTWMPAMGHGASVVPSVTAEGAGAYLVTDVVLFMAGEWQLRTKFSGPVTDTMTPSFTVP